MPLNHNNTRTFHRTLYATELETITLLKRGDDQNEGNVTNYVLFDCRHSKAERSGEMLKADMMADHFMVWHIPRVELDRVGVYAINMIDRIVDQRGWVWQAESDTKVLEKLFLNHTCVYCRRLS